MDRILKDSNFSEYHSLLYLGARNFHPLDPHQTLLITNASGRLTISSLPAAVRANVSSGASIRAAASAASTNVVHTDTVSTASLVTVALDLSEHENAENAENVAHFSSAEAFGEAELDLTVWRRGTSVWQWFLTCTYVVLLFQTWIPPLH